MTSSAAQKITHESAEILWFVARGTVLKGPFTTAQLQEKMKKREISFLDFCWRQGFREWRPIGSLEDFDRRHRLKSLPHYPSLEIPGGHDVESTPSNANHPLKQAVAGLSAAVSTKRFEVSFSKAKRYSISIYEWGFAAIFSVVLAYVSTDFALTEVQHNVEQHLAMMSLGKPQFIGEKPETVNPEFWQPMLSAPSYTESLPLSQNELPGMVSPIGDLPIQVEGLAVREHGTLSVGGMTVQSNSLPDLWTPETSGLDGVYAKRVILKGVLPVRAPASIEVTLPGEPRKY